MTFDQVRQFLANFNLTPETNATLTFDQYCKVIDTAKSWHGEPFSQFLMDCFMPMGEPVEKGFEDSLSHYVWTPSTWQELETDFNQSDLKG